MKKIIKSIILVFTFFVMTKNSYALVITEGNEIPNFKIHLKTANIDETRSISKMINSLNNEFLYTVTLESPKLNNNFTEYDFYSYANDLDEELRNKIMIITYYGYGYKKRTTNKWYGLTQYLIYEELVKKENGEIYFVDENLYENELNELRNDIAHYYDMPSFVKVPNYDTYNISLTDKLVLKDSSETLKDYNINNESNLDLDLKVKGNELTVIPNSITYGFIYFSRKLEELPRDMQFYIDGISQKFVNRGNIGKYYGHVLISVRLPKVKVQVQSINNLSVVGNEYKVYDDIGNGWGTLTINEEGTSNEISLMPGKYYLIENKTSYGYESNSEKIYFDLVKEDVTVEIESKPIKKHVTIKHQQIDEFHNISSSANKALSILSEDNNLIKEITTNKEGKAYIDLAYGTYKIIEKDALTKEVKETILKIDENFNEDKEIVIEEFIETENKNNTNDNKDSDNIIENKPNLNEENNSNKGSIVINKIDHITHKPLANLKYGLYNKDYELIDEGLTDINGKLIFKDLETGTYYIKEILNESNKEFDDSAIKVEVKETIDTIITSDNRSMINVPDTKLQSSNYTIIIGLALICLGSYSLNHEKTPLKKEIFN